MRRFAIVAAFFLIGGVLDAQQKKVNTMQQPVGQSRDQNAEELLIHTLQSALGPQGTAVRVYVHSACPVNKSKYMSFPDLDIQVPTKSETGLSAVRAIFRSDKNVEITQDRDGVIRIVIGDVFRSFLDTNLASVRLDKTAQYNPDGPGGAIALVESESTIEKSMRESKVIQIPEFYIGLRMPPLSGSRHLPPTINNVTVDGYLDLIVKTFPGVVIYSECMIDDSHMVDIRFDWFKSK